MTAPALTQQPRLGCSFEQALSPLQQTLDELIIACATVLGDQMASQASSRSLV